jgi:HK97 family phage major capsid protein
MDFAKLSPVQKGAILLSDIAPSGRLPEEVAEQFIVLAIKDQKLLKMIRVLPMKNPEKRIPKIQMNSRVLRAGQSAQALPQADYAKPAFTAATLASKLFKGTVAVPDEVYEDNVERQSLRQTLQGMIAERVGADLEEVAINGDTTSTDPFLAQFDGFIKKATSHPVPATTQLSRPILLSLFLAVPQEFRKDKSKIVFFTSTNSEMQYRNSLADRATPEGDRRLIEDGGPVYYSGMPIHDIPLWPYQLGAGSNETVTICCDPRNMVVGIQREIKVETSRDADNGADK